MTQFTLINDKEYPFFVGTLPNKEIANNFVDLLYYKGIEAKALPSMSTHYAINVKKEADVSRAKIELAKFFVEPNLKTLKRASWERGRKDTDKSFSGIEALFLNIRLKSVVTIVEVLCIALYLLYVVAGTIVYKPFLLYDMSLVIEKFNIWRLFTPALLHFSILHILFNLVMFEAFARKIENYFGWKKIFVIVFVISLISNLMQYYFIKDFTIFGGLSGVVYGVIGYMALLSQRKGLPYDLYIPKGLFLVSVLMIAFGFLISSQANMCHLSGLIVGVIIGFTDLKKKKLA